MTKLHYRDSSNNWKELSLSVAGGAAIVVNVFVADDSTQVTATDGKQTVVGNINNHYATIGIPTYGTWTFTNNGSTPSSIKQTFDVSKVYTIALGSKNLATDSWQIINAIAKSGMARQFYNVGDTKTLTLTSAISGTTSHLVRIIGINQDNDNSITFQTANCLATVTAFGSAATWSNSTAKTLCTNYYNAMGDAKAYVKTLSKGTNTNYNTSSVSYTDETVWLPSIFEMGLGSYEYAPKAAEYTLDKSVPYSYYTSNSSRIKKLGDSGSAQYYWTRSRSSYGANLVCAVLTDGNADSNFYHGTYGLAPAFCIGV